MRILFSSLLLSLTAVSAHAADDVMVVFDGSNSMWGQIDGTAKIEIARDAIGNLTAELGADTNVGLMAYGHRRRGDCSDIEVILPPGPLDRAAFLDHVARITPTGKTPLTDAVEQAAEALSFRDRPATVLLISDGLESCDRDPCALAATLARSGVSFTAHVVGFGLGAGTDTASLACIAEETGGKFLAADDAATLGAALSTVGAEVAQAPTEPEPEPEPEQEAEPQIEISAPQSVTQGAKFALSWDPIGDNSRDYVTIVPMGADDGVNGTYARVGDGNSAGLVAPADTGLYELRYMPQSGDTPLGRAAIEVVAAEVSLSAPDAALTGATFDVSWTGTVHSRDYVTIVPMGADDGTSGNYFRVGDRDGTKSLQAPADTGLYEVRYVLNEGKRVMARTTIEVTAPEVTVSVTEQVRVGESLRVEWTGAVHPRDYIAMVPQGSPDDTRGQIKRVGNAARADLPAPDAPGIYELRYILNEGKRVLARASVEVLAEDAQLSTGATLQAPETAAPGAVIEVSWTGGADSADQRITLARGDQAIFTWVVAKKIEGPPPLRLTLPDTPGLYELRFLDVSGQQVLSRAPIEIK